jgi:hypothetical protein
MQRTFLKALVIALLINLAAYGQSLGDVARENREKKDAEDASGAQPRVITNKDLPSDPEASQESHEVQETSTKAPDHFAEQRFAEQRVSEQRAGEQWRRRILAQENRVANLQARIDQIHASMRNTGGSPPYDVAYNRYQARQMARVAQIQQQLDEQKRTLNEMQDEARRAGMHTAVYDP